MPPRLRDFPGGYYIPEGWKPLVLPMIDLLEEMHADIHTCKEALGGLRVIVRGPSDEARRLYTGVSHKCNWICQDCGEPGVLHSNSHGLIKTCCDKHPPTGVHRRRIKDINWDLIRYRC